MNAFARHRVVGLAVLSAAVLAVYANHFDNAFHFDDSHAVENNAYIRNLKNVPLMFTDGRTFSSLPTNQSYRPLTTVSLAVDYWLGGGLDPFFFHLSTFILFLVQLRLMLVLFEGVLGTKRARWPLATALLAVAWYGLHPVMAETVNYVIQRSEVQATVGILAAFALWLRRTPVSRALYIVPVVLGTLGKPLAIMFAPLLTLYVVLFEVRALAAKGALSRTFAVLPRTLPAWLVCIGLYFFQRAMTPESFSTGGVDRNAYWLTQPFVALEYAKSFFWPVHLSADTDLGLLHSVREPRVIQGFAFIAFMATLAVLSALWRRSRPITFGIGWFFITLAPTSLTPLAEVANDHRMFMPFVGLVLAVAAALALVAEWFSTLLVQKPELALRVQGAAIVCVLMAFGTMSAMTVARNRVWHSEESLWADTVEKSPGNGRAWMNYGLTQMAKGDYATALALFEKAAPLAPRYAVLETNLGVAHSRLGHVREAEAAFQRAMAWSSGSATAAFFYARWLDEQGRADEAIELLTQAARVAPTDLEVRHRLLQRLESRQRWQALGEQVDSLAAIAPHDELLSRYKARLRLVSAYEAFQAKRYEDVIRDSQAVLALEPRSVEAFTNIGSAQAAMGKWDEAIDSARSALALNPQYTLAQNNLRWAQEMKAKAGGHQW